MLKGIIRANHPSGQHLHGDAVFTTAEQRFVVDPAAAANRLTGDEWVFTEEFYASLRPKIGQQLAVEPVGVKGGEQAVARIAELGAEIDRQHAVILSWGDYERSSKARIAELEAKVAELEAQLSAKAKK